MFKIQVSNSAVMEHQMKKEIAKLAARQLLKEKSGGHVAEAAEGITPFSIKDNWWASRVDMKTAIAESKKYKKDYERTLPEKLEPQAESFMWKRAKQLKDEFTMGMLSKEELHPVKGFLDGGTMKWVVDEEKLRVNNSVSRETAWAERNKDKIEEFKNLMRHLNPDNPNAGDIERFRPKRGI